MSSFDLPNARVEASRRNGAESRGPKSPEGTLTGRACWRLEVDERWRSPMLRLGQDPNGRTPMTEAAWRMVTQKCDGWRRNATG
jgi:hypothetical protein